MTPITLKPELPLSIDQRLDYLRQVIAFTPSPVRRQAAIVELERLRALRPQGRTCS